MKEEYIEKRYLKNSGNFRETLNFMEILDLIIHVNDKLSLQSKFRAVLGKSTKIMAGKNLNLFILNNLLKQNEVLSEYINEYLSHFVYKKGKYEIKLNTTKRLKFSGLRNLLIQLEFIYLSPQKYKYYIYDDKVSIFNKFNDSKKLSQKELEQLLQKKDALGKAAEIEIINYEKMRLSQYPELARKVKRISTKDVNAGYDIKSFSITNVNSGRAIPRFIEVKAVSPIDYKFFWSRNEWEKAKEVNKQYYLYLLPVLSKFNFNIEGLKIINEPYSKIYRGKGKWIKKEELISYSLPRI